MIAPVTAGTPSCGFSPKPIGRYILTDVFDYANQQAIGKDDDDEVMDQCYIEENTFCNDAYQEIFEEDEEMRTNQTELHHGK